MAADHVHPRKLLFVLSSGELGGAERALATHLACRPPEIRAHALVLSRGRAADLLRRSGVPTAEVALRRPLRFPGAAAFELRLAHALLQLRPDVVHATG